MAQGHPILVFLIGPAAVGKMSVGIELAARTGLKLFHNHQTIDLVLPFFAFGSPPFIRLVNQFRHRIFQEVAASDQPGLIFTYVWAFDHEADHREVAMYAKTFSDRGCPVYYVELQAPQNVRLQRNETPLRLEHKRFKRDLEASRRNLMQMDADYQLDSGERFAGRGDYLRIDNTALKPEEVAEMIIDRFGLVRHSPAGQGPA